VIWARSIDQERDCRLVEYFKQRHIWSLAVDDPDSIAELKPYPKELCQPEGLG